MLFNFEFHSKQVSRFAGTGGGLSIVVEVVEFVKHFLRQTRFIFPPEFIDKHGSRCYGDSVT